MTVTTINGTSPSGQVFVVKLTLKEIDFTGPIIPVEKDTPTDTPPPASPPWLTAPTTPPAWKASNPAGSNDPVAYAGGATMSATATFQITPAAPSAIPNVRIEGSIQMEGSLGKFVATGQTIPASQLQFTVTGITEATALPVSAQFYNPMNIDWYVSGDGTACGTNCALTGTSSNKLFVTFTTPTVPAVLSVLQLATAGGGSSQSAIFQNTWAQFAGPANVKGWDGRLLHYYRSVPPVTGFGSCATDPVRLRSFVSLFRWALLMNGVSSTLIQVLPIEDQTELIIKSWTFGPPSFPSDDPYQWKFVGNAGDPMVPASSVLAGGLPVYGDMTSLLTLAGQNSTPPSEKVFQLHYIVQVDPRLPTPGQGPYFDPSYGVWYTDYVDFESRAIEGYRRQIGNDLSFPGQFHVRKPGPPISPTIYFTVLTP